MVKEAKISPWWISRSLHSLRSVEMTMGRLVEMTEVSFRAKGSSVISSGAFLLSFRAQRSPVISSAAFSCHFKRNVLPCHFERSTKCGVEKSGHRPRQTGPGLQARSLHSLRSVEMTMGRLVERTEGAWLRCQISRLRSK